jgi:hypothetical protein
MIVLRFWSLLITFGNHIPRECKFVDIYHYYTFGSFGKHKKPIFQFHIEQPSSSME